MTRIAYVAPTGVFGGVRIVHSHLRYLTQRGHECVWIYTDPQPTQWLEPVCEMRPLADPGSGYDVVVGTAITTWPAAQQIAGSAKVMGLLQMAEWLFYPVGTKDHTDTQQVFVSTKLDGVMAISDWLALLAQTAGHDVYRIRNGLDTNLFYREPFVDLPPHDGITIATEGVSASPAKDCDEMVLRAVRRLRYDLGYHDRLRVIGFSQQRQPNEIFDRYWTLPPQSVIRMIYGSADIFLKASRYEGRPGPDLEAMACGAVVCRAIGTGGDDLIHERNCLVTDYGDMDGFVANLQRLIDDGELRERLRAGAYEYIRAECGWDKAMDTIEQAVTGSITPPEQRPAARYDYDLATYDTMQAEISEWEAEQARWLGETLLDMLHPRSVIDIGCGPGIYLTPFKPDARVYGVDGAPQAGGMLEPHEFARIDLRDNWHPAEHYDLALCIETAEHLPPDRSDYLVDLITGCADACLWSAAHPGQGGVGHINERPLAYWLDMFARRGWARHPRDAELRALIAENPHCRRVQWLIPNAVLLTRNNHDIQRSNYYE